MVQHSRTVFFAIKLIMALVMLPIQAHAEGEPVYINTNTVDVSTSQANANINNADVTSNVNQANITIQEANLSQRPHAPTGVVVSNITQDSLEISWQENDPLEEVAQYNIYQDGVAIVSTDQDNCQVSGLASGRSYSYFVTATNSFGEGQASEVVTVETVSKVPEPYDLSVVNLVYSGAVINWRGSAPEYKIYLDDNAIDSTNNNSYTISYLEPEKNYQVYVTSIDENGYESKTSNKVSFQTMAVPEPFDMKAIFVETWVYVEQIGPYLGIAFGIGFAFLIAQILPVILRRVRWRW